MANDFKFTEETSATTVRRLIERANKLERRLTDAKKLAREWEYDCRAVRARAEQLERRCAVLSAQLTSTDKENVDRVEQLETALRKYGKHTTECRYNVTSYGGTIEPCDCGLDAALDGGTATPEES